MNNSNIKLYLGISFALIILFILVLIIPFTKKPATQNNTTNSTGQQIFPTSVETNPSPVTIKPTPITVPAHFTGAIEETIPKQVIDLAAQKKDLLSKVPLSLTTFTIDFDYSTDKFVVTLKDPKDQAQKEFESWRAANYPGLSTDQFLLK